MTCCNTNTATRESIATPQRPASGETVPTESTPSESTAHAPSVGEGIATFRPAIDVIETDQDVIVRADLPGVRREDVEIDFNKNTLSLRASVAQRDPASKRPLLREYGVGNFARSFRLGEGIDPSGISAELAGGVLTLRLPKVQSLRPRRIGVSAG